MAHIGLLNIFFVQAQISFALSVSTDCNNEDGALFLKWLPFIFFPHSTDLKLILTSKQSTCV